jgi:hypothetical protein
MTTQTPPFIMNGKIALFGHKGKEIYRVKSIYFFSCKDWNGECIHDLSMTYEDWYGSLYYFDISNVRYEDLVQRNYILYFKESNKKMLDIVGCEHCMLKNLPIVK